ncbi:MAG: thiamine ABC transporter substrate binding subunit [Termitinemataceae bacterium]|nr:MAG: thiamine ABC transporter substrate binding subunit [Termitinemataceae bacterium]
MNKSKNFAALALCVVLGITLPSCTKQKEAGNTITIWTYDSFVSEWGPGDNIASRFKEKTGIAINWEGVDDAGVLVSRLLLEGDGAKADIVLGIDQNLSERALKTGLFEDYTPKTAENLLAQIANLDFKLIPFDYSYFSIIYDSEKIQNPPQSLEDLTKPEFKRSLILLDPRSSSPGLGFLAWTEAVYGRESVSLPNGVSGTTIPAYLDYWSRLKPSILTIAEGWSSGYGLFTKGEAPLVLSYTTSPAYHIEYEQTERYRAAVFEGGHPIQIELAGLLKNAPNKEAAKTFLDFMLMEDFQETIPLGNWMYPVIECKLPPSFTATQKPQHILSAVQITDADLDDWVKTMN